MKTRWIAPIVGRVRLALAGPARAQVRYVDGSGAVAVFSVLGGVESEEKPEPLNPEERS
jgi:hypothetical protein